MASFCVRSHNSFVSTTSLLTLCRVTTKGHQAKFASAANHSFLDLCRVSTVSFFYFQTLRLKFDLHTFVAIQFCFRQELSDQEGTKRTYLSDPLGWDKQCLRFHLSWTRRATRGGTWGICPPPEIFKTFCRSFQRIQMKFYIVIIFNVRSLIGIFLFPTGKLSPLSWDKVIWLKISWMIGS